MTPVSSPMLATGSLTASHVSDREKLAGAAKQFEAIFLRQMLSAARKTDFGGEKLLGGQGIDTFRTMQDEHFADVAAGTGGFGLAAMIEKQLTAQFGTSFAPGASTGSARAGSGLTPGTAQPEPVEGPAATTAKGEA